MSWTTSTVISYNGVQIESWGPQLLSNYQAAYTTITIVVQAGTVTITSSNSNLWVDTITIPLNVVTTSKLYSLYLSNQPANSNQGCAGGYIQNVYIYGKCFLFLR